MKHYTKIPNEMLEESDLKIPERYLYCVLLRYCGKKDHCWPSQETLSREIGLSGRQIRTLLKSLADKGIVQWKRRGWNRANTYRVFKDLVTNRKLTSAHLGSIDPLHQRNVVPPKSIYLKEKRKRSVVGGKRSRAVLEKKGVIPTTKIVLRARSYQLHEPL